MDDDEFKAGVRFVLLFTAAAFVILIFVVCCFYAHGYIKRVDPDPPTCMQVLADGTSQEVKVPDPSRPQSTAPDAGK